MTAGNVSRVIRAPGRLVVNPLDQFSDVSKSYPYGGTEIGRVNQCALNPAGNQPFRVMYESLGAVGAVLEGDNRWVFSCFVRAWDREAVQHFLSDGYAAGDYTQHAVFSSPGINVPGSSAASRAVVLAYVPDDEIHVPGILMYSAIPDWTDGADLVFRRGEELGLPITFECIQDSSGRILQIGKLADLTL